MVECTWLSEVVSWAKSAPEEGDEYEPSDNEGERQQSQEAQQPRGVVGPPEAPPLASESPIMPARRRLR